MTSRSFEVAAMAAIFLAATPAIAQERSSASKTAEAVAGLARLDGLLPVYVDKEKGRILIALPAADANGVSGRFLYVTALKTGLGSAPVGLDRARLGRSEILVFRRIGQKVIAEYENPRFVAAGASADTTIAAAGVLFKTTAKTLVVITAHAAATTPVAGTLEVSIDYYVEDLGASNP